MGVSNFQSDKGLFSARATAFADAAEKAWRLGVLRRRVDIDQLTRRLGFGGRLAGRGRRGVR
jgi:hypothetical protein